MCTARLPVVDWTDHPLRFKWTRPSHRKTKSGFCTCAITFQTRSTKTVNTGNNYILSATVFSSVYKERGFYETPPWNPKCGYRQKYRALYIKTWLHLFLPARLYRLESALFDWNCISPIVRPSWTACFRTAPTGCVRNPILGTLMKIYWEAPKFAKIGQKYLVLCLKT
jgi:hypothetical protein